jgi:hypothetical protein
MKYTIEQYETRIQELEEQLKVANIVSDQKDDLIYILKQRLKYPESVIVSEKTLR